MENVEDEDLEILQIQEGMLQLYSSKMSYN